ncbi:MAG: hypothetical protein WCK05_07855 [Planctomycetota bacterium]
MINEEAGRLAFMSRTMLLLAIVAVIPASVAGDAIIASGDSEGPVESISGFSDGVVTYLLPSGEGREKSLGEILQMTITDNRDFSRAEQFRRDKKYVEATRLYDAVISTGSPPWLAQLARYRKVDVTTRAGQVDAAVSCWMTILAKDSSVHALQLGPKTFAPKGDERNLQAITALELECERLKSPAAQVASLNVLVGLCKHENLEKKVEKYSKELAKRTVGVPSGGGGPEGPEGGPQTRPSDIATGEDAIVALRDAVKLKDAEIRRLRDENVKLKEALEKRYGRAAPENSSPAPAATPQGGNALVKVVRSIIQGMQEAGRGATTLQKGTYTTKVLSEANATLKGGTVVLTYAIRDISRDGREFSLSLDPPIELKSMSGTEYSDSTTVNLPESKAMTVKPGDLLILSCKASCSQERHEGTGTTLFSITTDRGDVYVRGNDCKYSIEAKRRP